MAALFASGRAVDIVLLFIALEIPWLVLIRRQPLLSVLLMVLPGTMMVLGVRAAITGMAWPWVAAALTASLPLHLADVRRRGMI
jgi:hypothetical protein